MYATTGGSAMFDPSPVLCRECGKRVTQFGITVQCLCLTCWGREVHKTPLVDWLDIPNCFTGKVGGESLVR